MRILLILLVLSISNIAQAKEPWRSSNYPFVTPGGFKVPVSKAATQQKQDVGRWRWSKAEQDWHYASVQIWRPVGRRRSIGGSGTCIAVDNPLTEKIESALVVTNQHVVLTVGAGVTVEWLKPGGGMGETKGRVLAVSSSPDLALIKTIAPPWVKSILPACTKCGDIAYHGTEVEVNSFGGRPTKGKDNLRNFLTTVKDYHGSVMELAHPIISGDSGGSIITHDIYWPRLLAVNARSDAYNGEGPTARMVNQFLENYYGQPRCTGQGECLPGKQNMFIFRLLRKRCGPNGCGPNDGDNDTHPEEPGDRDPPSWFGPATPTKPKEPIVTDEPSSNEDISKLAELINKLQESVEYSDVRLVATERSVLMLTKQVENIVANQRATANSLSDTSNLLKLLSEKISVQTNVDVNVDNIVKEATDRLFAELTIEVIPVE